ncbi:RNA polymerase sigma factor [Phytohabitans aurantiacus]|uniref:RNA polymerase sigma factor n=1 Tax=Phytohabitans aurantiacus TaxID=3016789 RepID=A0ABQ5R740_9ACTN|nr:sigma-70 family RNA polymerase sigma factor [Phytohabitans aurantiacus]GLI02200.1 RNA polymerase sigma factor [Phytohabitans aurantiacus]
MRDDPVVVMLVARARSGEAEAWHQIVDRYAPLVWGICRRYRLSQADSEDVGQNVWLKLHQHLASLRDPAALPGWLARTTYHECLAVLRAAQQRRRAELADEAPVATDGGFAAIERDWERERWHIALREAYAQLRPHCRELLALLFEDPPVPYREIGERLGMKVGSIGPTRERCLADLRRCRALAMLIEAERAREGGEVDVRPMVER